MKKSLLLLSVLGASAAAHAQTTATLAGTVDTMLSRGTGSLTDRTTLGSGGNATSKIIVRVTEDLGGGMAGFLHLESGMLTDHGAFQATQTNNQPTGTATAPAGTQGMTFNRRSIVGLRSSWGTVHLGRDWSPMYDAFTGRYDPFGVAVGIGINYQASISSTNGAVRMSNDLVYITPQFFGGFTANIQHWLGENPSGAANSKDGSGDGIRLEWDKGPISARAHWGRTHMAAGDAVYRAVAASYNFGPAKVSAVYNPDRQGALKQKGLLLGLWVPVGVGEIKASYSQHKSNLAGDPTAKKLAVGYVHNLSKRTAVYTTFARVKNSGGARFALNGATTGPNESSNGLDIGIRHNF